MASLFLEVWATASQLQRQRWFVWGGRVGMLLLLAVPFVIRVPAVNARPISPFPTKSFPRPEAAQSRRATLTFPTVNYGPTIGVPVVPTVVYPQSTYPQSDITVQVGPAYSSGYGYGQPNYWRRSNINNSVLVNPTVVNGSIRNSTLINPTIVTTPNYPAPYYPGLQILTVTTTNRPEPEVVIDPQYGVRYKSPSDGISPQVVIDPQYGVRYQSPSGY